jgi:hypothetical protein
MIRSLSSARFGALLLLAFLAIPQNHAAEPEAAASSHWAKPDQQKVYYSATPKLEVRLAHLGADDDYWDQLDISVRYDGASLEHQAAQLRDRYPGLRVHRAVAEASGEWVIRVPALGKVERIKAVQSQDGPYVNLTYFVPRERSAALRTALKNGRAAAVSIEGRLSVTIPDHRVVERVELGPEACSGFTREGRTLYHALRAFATMERELDGRPFKYESTREGLKRSILETCVELPAPREARSFKELLSSEIETGGREAARPFGETRMVSPAQEAAPFRYELSLQIMPEDAR